MFKDRLQTIKKWNKMPFLLKTKTFKPLISFYSCENFYKIANQTPLFTKQILSINTGLSHTTQEA